MSILGKPKKNQEEQLMTAFTTSSTSSDVDILVFCANSLNVLTQPPQILAVPSEIQTQKTPGTAPFAPFLPKARWLGFSLTPPNVTGDFDRCHGRCKLTASMAFKSLSGYVRILEISYAVLYSFLMGGRDVQGALQLSACPTRFKPGAHSFCSLPGSNVHAESILGRTKTLQANLPSHHSVPINSLMIW